MRATIVVASLLAAHVSAASEWLASIQGADGMVSACFNQYESAGTMLMQCGAPTTSQLAKSSQLTKDENTGQLTGTVTEFLSITDHSILLVDHNGTETSVGATEHRS